MKILATALLAATAGFVLSAPANASPQVTVQVGPAPECPYGYYDVPPYTCAPYGYYGPEWFDGGAFVGVGPWFHEREGWRGGWVDNRFHPDHGYHGPYPARGEHRDESRHMDANHFRGNEMRDGRGHVVDHRKK